MRNIHLIPACLLLGCLFHFACDEGTFEVPDSYGTLDALFDQRGDILIVKGTQGFRTENELLSDWADLLKQELNKRGQKTSVIDDQDLDLKNSKNQNLLFVGRPEANSLLKEYVPKLPVYFGKDMFQVGDKIPRTAFGEGAQICIALPHPYTPEYMVGIFSIIFEQEFENMYWYAAPLGERADYVMWQPTKGPTMGAGFVLRGMFQDIFSKPEFLSSVNTLKSETLAEYRDSALTELESIKTAALNAQINHPEPLSRPDELKREVVICEVKTACNYSPILDYMYLLFTNSLWRGVDFQRLLLPQVPLGRFGPISLPEYAAVDDLGSYSQLYSLAEMYDPSFESDRMLTHGRRAPSYDQIGFMLKEGEIFYPEFVKLWKTYIEPVEQRMTERWEQDIRLTDPVGNLQKLTGLRWPTSEFHLCVSVFHPSGSALPTDPFVFSCIFKEEELLPNAAWVIGHEGTHILLNSLGEYWEETDQGKAVIETWGEDVEEAICLLMQNRLAWACGFINEEEIQKFDPNSSYGPTRLAFRMNEQWDSYLNNPEKFPTIIDFMIDVALSIEE
jgi:hypothetical protein